MYTLLLVTDKADVRALYERFAEWENLGFAHPTIAVSAEQGIALLSKFRYDAISWLLSVREGKQFFAYLSRRPEMLGMETVRDEERLRRELSNTRRKLSSRDATRRIKRVDDLTSVMQGEFLRDLLRGTVYDRSRVDERMRTLKFQSVQAEYPVVTASFHLPQGDYFLQEVWHYGRERLESALRNIFEADISSVCYVLLMVNPHHMRLLGVPLEHMTSDELYRQMNAHLSKCSALLDEYFELTLIVRRVVRYESLYALCEGNRMRVTH